MLPRFLCLFALCAALLPPAFGVEWMTDLPAARAKAKAEKKLILFDFTGSDWCSSCITLRKNVLDTPEFEAYAADKFVCVEVDVPHTKKLPAALAAQNAALCEQYGIRVFPTVVAADAGGQIVGGFQGSIDTAALVQKQLDRAVKAGKKYRRAAKQQGEERAKSLFTVWTTIPAELRGGSADMKAEIIRLDKSHSTGMDAELAAEKQMAEFMAEAYHSTGSKDFARITRKYAPIALPQNKLEIYRWHINMTYASAETEEELRDVQPYVRELCELDPTLSEENKRQILAEYADPAKLLQKSKAERADKAR